MKLFTGCFAQNENMESAGITCFSISRISPPGMRQEKNLILLAPSHTLLMGRKSGVLTDEQFAAYYSEQLSYDFYNGNNHVADNILDYIQLKTSGAEKVGLLCWEKYGSFCHRHVLSNMLALVGTDITEFGINPNGFNNF